jgi:hypothetical protein
MNHKGRLSKLETKHAPQSLTWRELVEIARMDEAARNDYMRANPDKAASYSAAITAAGGEAAEMIEALR